MAFHSQSLYRECSRYPYTGSVSVGEQDRVDFTYQFVKKRFIPEFSGQGFINSSVFYTAGDITGKPTKFLNSKDIPKIFVKEEDMKEDILLFPWKYKSLSIIHEFLPVPCNRYNYIDIEFHEAVYPIRVSIYEIYNPGNVLQIWAQDYTDNQWFLLWDGLIESVLSTSRLFSPPLNPCYFKTKMLKLQFSYEKHYSVLDAVMLIGTSELILPKNSEKSITETLKKINCMHFHTHEIHNLTANFENAHLDIVILQENFSEYCKSNVGEDFYESFNHEKVSEKELRKQLIRQIHRQSLSFNKKCWNSEKCLKYIDLSSDKSEEPYFNLSVLPDEIILKIFKKLDFTSLCRMNQVNKRFNDLTQDPRLYTRLNLSNVHPRTFTLTDIFRYFSSRCKYLKQLDLSCSTFATVKNFIKFLHQCGRRLTHLRLNNCKFVDDFAVLKISEICENLKVLDLESCHRISNKGFSYLENLNNLEYLNLTGTANQIKTSVLCKILQSNPEIRELHLNGVMLDFYAVAKELRNSCQKLETVYTVIQDRRLNGDISIGPLADCKNLRKIHLCGKFNHSDDSLYELFSSCQHLEEIHLTYCLTDNNLVSLTQCKNLKRLHLYRMEDVTSNNYSIIFEQCPKLQEIVFLYCDISDCMINQWREKYPYVSMYVLGKVE